MTGNAVAILGAAEGVVTHLITGLVASWALTSRPIEWDPEAILEGKDELRPAQVKTQGRGGADRKPV